MSNRLTRVMRTHFGRALGLEILGAGFAFSAWKATEVPAPVPVTLVLAGLGATAIIGSQFNRAANSSQSEVEAAEQNAVTANLE